MSCPYHRGLCAFPDWHADRCENCHCDWVKITAPAVAPVYGYGETPLNHLWRHAADLARGERASARRRSAA